jgi:branched-subunit amino acid ABC-type transport system permease component
MSQYLFNGLMIGGIYGLAAVAYSVVYGVLGMVNFAFGEVFMFGAFGAVILSQSEFSLVGRSIDAPGWTVWLALPAGVAIGAGVGLLVERTAYRPLRNAPMLSLLITSIAASLLLRSIAQFLFGAGQTAVSSPVANDAYQILGARVPRMDALIFVIALLAMSGFAATVRFTPIGRAIRATAQDRDTARLRGISVERVIMATFLLGSAMAALAGILYSIRFQFASATMGFVPGLKALVAAVLGGIGNVQGAFVGGLVLGVAEVLGAAYVPNGSAYRDVVAFAALGLILWLRPQGLLGRRHVVKV